MAIVKPFKAWRPKTEYAKRVSALPYDVMSSTEAAEMAAGNPYSFLHVSKAEIDLPATEDIHSEKVYIKALENFRKLIQEGILIQEEKDCYYLYGQTMAGRRQLGIVGCSSIDDYFSGVIKKHEFTRPEKELDRINHMKTLSAHAGPIFLTIPDNQRLENIIQTVTKNSSPIYDFITEDGVGHTVWIIREDKSIDEIEEIFIKEIPCTYIADGHHRTASAAKVGQSLRQENIHHSGSEDYNFFLSVIFPSSHLAIMDYNRVVRDLNGHQPDTFLDALKNVFEVEKHSGPYRPEGHHQIGLYLNRQWYKLTVLENDTPKDPIGVLDVSILQERVLAPLLGIKDPRTDKRIDFVGGIRGLEELQRRVDSGEMAAAFALFPVSLQQLIDIADSGEVMPPKSTWFEPKLRDGLFVHTF